jgi:ribosomal protein S18 acetylase RimI-like enzyme
VTLANRWGDHLEDRRWAKLKEVIRTANQVRASQGLSAAASSFVRNLKRQLFFSGDCFLYARWLNESMPPRPAIDNLEFIEAGPDDLHFFEEVQTQSDVLWYKLLLERKRSCIMALKNNQLVAYGWFTTQLDPLVERTYVPLAEDEIFVYDLYTKPAFRRQGIQSSLLQHILELAGKRGCKRALSLVQVGNDPSVKLHEKLGFHVISRFTKVRILALVRFYFRPNPFGKAGNLIRWL